MLEIDGRLVRVFWLVNFAWNSEHSQDISIRGLNLVLFEFKAVVLANLLEALSGVALSYRL